MKAIVKEQAIKIIDSWQIDNRWGMQEFLQELQNNCPSAVWHRSMESLVNEWVTHNRLYNRGLWIEHTKDVDFEAAQPWWLSVIYWILSR